MNIQTITDRQNALDQFADVLKELSTLEGDLRCVRSMALVAIELEHLPQDCKDVANDVMVNLTLLIAKLEA